MLPETPPGPASHDSGRAATARLLLVDDDRQLLWSLNRLLGAEGYSCSSAVSAGEALRAVSESEFDLVMLDLGLPDLDGLVLLRRLRDRSSIPVVVLTARGATSDKVLGLEIGADDFVVKPFEPQELLARVRANLRRSREYSARDTVPNVVRVAELEVDLDAREVYLGGRRVSLTPVEYSVLATLAQNAGRAISADWLYEHAWGYTGEVAGKSPAVYMRRLRRKIEQDPAKPEYLQTVRGFGYRLSSPNGSQISAQHGRIVPAR